MTTQTAVAAAETGLTLTGKLFTVAAPDTEVTGNTISVTERTNAKGEYIASIVRATALPSGDYTLILFDGTRPASISKRTFAGTDGEVATVTKVTAELDPATRVKLAAEQPDCNVLRTDVEYKHTQNSAGDDTVNVTIEEA